MLVKNIFSNPLHGIKPGEEGELPKNRESRLKQYVKYGMLEIVGEEVATEQPEAPKKTRRRRKVNED
jgi:hypothetical protein